jgi:ubiquinone biosynthesis protein COQ9
MTEQTQDTKEILLDAALMHVPFDGWSSTTFDAAVADSQVDKTVARAACPRGAVDLAVAYHKRGDALMLDAFGECDVSTLKYSEKVATLLRLRLEVVSDKEAVRRGTTLFALPQYAPDGAKLIWGTCDAIWDALGDTSQDVNWYTKRATLSGVYSATVLYWLGDTSEGHSATAEFIDRRIENVMQIEKVKSQLRENPTFSKLMTGPNWLLGQIKAPNKMRGSGLPGSWATRFPLPNF